MLYMRKFLISLVAVVCTLTATIAIPSSVTAQQRPVVYLTFDDGLSSNSWTTSFLDLLDQYNATATFFVNGTYISGDADRATLNRMVDAGHAVGNHTQTHARLTSLSYSSIQNQFIQTNNIVRDYTNGNYEMTCYRPPYGASNQTVRNAAASVGLTNSGWTANYPSGNGGGWDIDTNDWRYSTSGIRNELNKIRGGEVVLMHDGGGNRSNGYNALSGWLAANHELYDFQPLPDCGGVETQSSSYLGPLPDPNDSSGWYEFQIERLYQAYFLRPADAGGFEYWKGIYRSGYSLAQISDYFAGSNEFQSRYGTLTNDEYVELLYNNVLRRPSDPDGKAYWLGVLNGGRSRGDLMLFFSESPEYANLVEPEITGYTSYELEAQRRVTAAG